MSTTIIKLKRTIIGTVPSSLNQGEVMIDLLNGLLYWEDTSNVIHGMNIYNIRQGTGLVNFGSTPSTLATLVVSAPGILTTSFVQASILVLASSDNTLDQHYSELIQVTTGNIVANTSFTIYAVPTGIGGLTGHYNVQYLWR